MSQNLKGKIIAGVAAFGFVALTVFGNMTAANAADAPPDPTTSQIADATVTVTPDPVAPAADPAPEATPQEAAPAEPATPPAPAATETPVTPEPPAAPAADPAPAATEPVTPAATPTEPAAPVATPAAPVAKVAQQPQTQTPKKVFVCKYVGTPGVDERLQTGNNPISVSVNAIQHNQWDGTVPGYFSDAHDRSYVLAYDTGQPKPNVSACPQPEGPKETCVPDANAKYSHVLNYANGATTITVTGGAKDEPLCSPLNLSIALYAYTLAGKVFPGQVLVAVEYEYLDKVGVYTFNPGYPATCRQIDWYASKKGLSATIPSPILNASHDPYEPDFLSQYSSGPASYNSSSADNCAGIPESKVTESNSDNFVCGVTEVTVTHTVTTTPYKVVYQDGKIQFVLDTDNAKTMVTTSTRPPTEEEIQSCKPDVPPSEVKVTDESHFVCGDTEDHITRTTVTTPYKAVLVEGQWKIVIDHANITTVVTELTQPLTDEQIQSCKPESKPPTVVPSEWTEGQPACGATSVEQTRTLTKTTYKVVLVSGSTWDTVVDTVSKTTEHQTRQLKPEEVTACPTGEHTTPPSTTVSQNQPPANQPPVLASTGSTFGFGAAIAAFVAALAGSIILVVRRFRRPATDQQ